MTGMGSGGWALQVYATSEWNFFDMMVVGGRRYALTSKQALRACFSRELLLMKRHMFIYIFRTFSVEPDLVSALLPILCHHRLIRNPAVVYM
jgi:hypothetical protein